MQYYTSLVAGYDLLRHLPQYDKIATLLTKMSAGEHRRSRPRRSTAAGPGGYVATT